MKALCFCIVLFTIFMLVLGNIANYEKYFGDSLDPNNLVISLKRQKTPRQQILNAPEYGTTFDWLYKKPNNRTNDSIALYRFLDIEFYGEIVVGHPGQKLNVAFDTTWTKTWVLSSQCDSIKIIGCWFHNKYDHKKSSEYWPDGRPFIQNEGSYNLTGFYSYENISVAHSNVGNQSFIEMTYVNPGFLLSKIDGIMGLALKVSNYDPFFYTLRKQNKIKNPIYSIYINRDRQSKHGGNVMLGFIEQRHFHKTNNKFDPLYTFDVDPTLSYWQFSMNRVIFDSPEPAILCPQGCKAIVDTSANTIIGPTADIAKIHDLIEARAFFFGYHVVNCETVMKLPKLHFVMGGHNFTIGGTDYIMRVSYRSITMCVSAFQGASTSFEQDRWILGGAFLAQYYSIYNTDTKEISFVKAA